MNGTAAARFFRLGASLAGLVTLGWVMTGLAAKPVHHGVPVPTDWSHRHLIFSNSRTAERAARVSQDPRFWQQMHRREERLALPAGLLSMGPRVAPQVTPSFGPRITPSISRGGALTRRILNVKTNFHRDWSEDLGLGAAAGAGNYPAKFSFDSTTAFCGSDPTPDYVVYSTGLAGAPGPTGQADIVAFDNLYSGCTPALPAVYWAYNTSGAGTGKVLTSPVLSLDGSQIAFVQTSGSAATVVVLKWQASATDTVANPTSLTASGSYPTCTAPCMAVLPLQDRTHTAMDDTTSSIFVDYKDDVAWVGDSGGNLHKFHPFFTGTPTEIADTNWPLAVSALPLGSPVYDSYTSNVYVAGAQDGFLYRVDATVATVTQSGQLDFAGSLNGPIVDSSNGLVYAFAAEDNSGSCPSAPPTNCAGVYQLSANFAATDLGTEATVGAATISSAPLYDGSLNNAYYTSGDATGKMFVCGNVGAEPTLYEIPIAAGALNSGFPPVSSGVAIGVLGLSASNPACSPVTDVYEPAAVAGNPATELLFASVQSESNTAGCAAGGCIVNMIDTPWQASTNYSIGKEVLVQSANPQVRRIYVVVGAGTSGTSEPHWPITFGSYVTDPDPTGVTWLNQGNPAKAVNPWIPLHPYTSTTRILDSNGYVQVVEATGTSGPTTPLWSTTPGDPTLDGSVVWANAGVLPTIGMASNGGTSAIIIDNTVSSGTPTGTSQVYFTTLGDQICGTSGGNGGCAVQASQSALQ